MPEGGIFVKVKRSEVSMQLHPGSEPYETEDISAQLVDHLCFKYGYSREGARDLVQWYWQDEEDTAFIQRVKREFLESGLLGKDYIPE